MSYREPTLDELKDPLWNRIWQVIKSWDINVPGEYELYMNATGNHVCAIYDAVREESNEADRSVDPGRN
jgi:hypothetical protein